MWERAYPDVQTVWRRLATYLGQRFDPALTDFECLRHFLDQESARLHPNFYEHSVGYLYDLTWFHYMDAKDGFFRTLLEFADEHGLNRIADIGCGFALDAQALLHGPLRRQREGLQSRKRSVMNGLPATVTSLPGVAAE